MSVKVETCLTTSALFTVGFFVAHIRQIQFGKCFVSTDRSKLKKCLQWLGGSFQKKKAWYKTSENSLRDS